MKKYMIGAAAAMMAMTAASQASAVTVTFEGLTGNTTYGQPLTVSGLTFTNSQTATVGDQFYVIAGADSANGTNTLAPNYYDSTTTVTSTGLFTLTSLQLSDAFDFGDDPFRVNFTFNTTSGVQTRTVTLDTVVGMQTATFNISGISSFSFVAVGSLYDENTVQLDNIIYTLATTPTPAVPETATWAMMIGGFGMMGGVMRRRAVRTSVTYA